MKPLVVLAMLAACTSDPEPAASTVSPAIEVRATAAEMSAAVAFVNDNNHAADVDVTFRGHTWHLGRPTDGYSAVNVYIPLDHPVDKDEPIVFTVDAIAMTFALPPPIDFVDVPPFISRSGSATIRWTQTSADELLWYTQTSPCVRGGGMVAPNATSVTFAPTDWLPPETTPSTATCTTDVSFTRSRGGTVDPAFPGGQVELDQTFDAVFASTP